jgi:dipeptidyl aminopeptidase/acylaminoacyl peptidase
VDKLRGKDLESRKHRRFGDIWMASWDGTRTLQLTHTADSGREPAPFQPDGRYSRFAARDSGNDEDKEKSAGLILDRSGGEARKLTDFPEAFRLRLSRMAGSWRLASILIQRSWKKKRRRPGKTKTPKPIVIDRYQFKQDGDGYLQRLRDHLYLFAVATGKSDILTPGDFDEALPRGRLTGRSSRSQPSAAAIPTATRTPISISSSPGRERAETAHPVRGPRRRLPEVRPLFLLTGSSSPTSGGISDLLVLRHGEACGDPGRGRSRAPRDSDLDRAVSEPSWSSDGKSIYFCSRDDRSQMVARVPAAGGAVERFADAEGVVYGVSVGKGANGANGDRLAVVASTPYQPAEVMAVEGKKARAISSHNRELLDTIELGALEGIEFESRDAVGA